MQENKNLNSTIVRLNLVLNFTMLFICFHLWINTKPLPIFPIVSAEWLIPEFLEYPLFFSFIVLHILALLKPTKLLNALIVFMYLILVLNDQNRIVTYHYQVMIMLVLYVLNTPSHIYKWLFIGIYFWGGMHKFNPCFFNYFSNLELYGLPHFFNDFLSIGIPTIETLLALGLIFKATRKKAAFGLMFMHLMIIAFSILKLKAYSIVPWNVINCVLLYILFWKNQEQKQTFYVSRLYRFLSVFILLVTIFIGPLLNKFNAWDDFLAFKMYTYDVNQFYYEVDDSITKLLPQEIQKSYRKDINGKTIFYVFDWFKKVNKTPMYPEERNLFYVKQYLQGYLPEGNSFDKVLILKNYDYCE